MCGFVGMLIPKDSLGKDDYTALLSKMACKIKHRGPDDAGQWCDHSRGIGLAHRRLSIIDLSTAGQQPMLSHSGCSVIAYNGEIYNFQVIKKEIENSGYLQWRSQSDTEVLLEAIELWGIKRALQKSVGMFSFAFWDTKADKLFLARDRMGEKPLYYGFNNGVFIFGSDLAAFKEQPNWCPKISMEALDYFLKYGYIPAPYSIYEGIKKVPPGTFLEIDASTCLIEHSGFQPKPYWTYPIPDKAHDTDCNAGGGAATVNHLERLIVEVVQEQKVSDVPLGVFLSGGIDSSLITAILNSYSEKPAKTFSIGFFEESYNEAEYARSIAETLKTEHTELYISAKDMLDEISNLTNVYSEPFADVSALPTIMVARLAKENVTVCLSGDGGDELFHGYSRYERDYKRWNTLEKVPNRFKNGLGKLIEIIPIQVLDYLLFWGALFRTDDLRNGSLASAVKRLGIEMQFDSLEELYDFRLSAGVLTGEFSGNVVDLTSAIKDTKGDSLNGVDFMATLDALTYLPDDILVKVDRAAMAASLETRVPLLDHRIVEFAANMPNSLKVKDGELKWALKEILYKYVPKNLVDRPKMGFGVPMGRWLKTDLKEWAEDMLNSDYTGMESVKERLSVSTLWNDHINGHYNHQTILWRILMYQDWYACNY